MSLQRLPGYALLAHKALSTGKVQSMEYSETEVYRKKINFIHDLVLAPQSSVTILKSTLSKEKYSKSLADCPVTISARNLGFSYTAQQRLNSH